MKKSYTANAICHFDVSGPDDRALHQFYAAVFKWSVAAQGPGYAQITTPAPLLSGSVVDTEDASLIMGVSVLDVNASIAAAVSSGGSVVMPRTDNGWVIKAQIADPAGNRITLIQM